MYRKAGLPIKSREICSRLLKTTTFVRSLSAANHVLERLHDEGKYVDNSPVIHFSPCQQPLQEYNAKRQQKLANVGDCKFLFSLLCVA
jgi:hypothetical protein